MKENPITASTTTPALDPTAHHDNHSHPPVSLAPIKIFHHQHQEKNYHYWSTGTSRLHYFLHIASAPPSTQIKSNPLGWQKDREGENLYHIKSAAFSVGARTEEERTLFTRLEGKELLIPPLAYCTVCNGKGDQESYCCLLFAQESLSPWHPSAWQALGRMRASEIRKGGQPDKKDRTHNNPVHTTTPHTRCQDDPTFFHIMP